MVDEPGERGASVKKIWTAAIYNTTSGVPWNCRPYSGIILDELAQQGYVLPCMAPDDAHQYTGDETKSYLMVQADELSRDAILEAIAQGRFMHPRAPFLD